MKFLYDNIATRGVLSCFRPDWGAHDTPQTLQLVGERDTPPQSTPPRRRLGLWSLQSEFLRSPLFECAKSVVMIKVCI